MEKPVEIEYHKMIKDYGDIISSMHIIQRKICKYVKSTNNIRQHTFKKRYVKELELNMVLNEIVHTLFLDIDHVIPVFNDFIEMLNPYMKSSEISTYNHLLTFTFPHLNDSIHHCLEICDKYDRLCDLEERMIFNFLRLELEKSLEITKKYINII